MFSAVGVKAYGASEPVQTKAKYSENLYAIQENKNGTYTKAQVLQANKKMNEREYSAYGYLAGDATPQGIAKFAQAYLDFYNNLSPEEQTSDRYKGTNVSSASLLSAAKSQMAAGSGKSTGKPDELKDAFTIFMDAFRENDKRLKDGGASRDVHAPKDKATFSAQALQLSMMDK